MIGHSGCGKSTLLNVVAGLTNASQGYVFLDNREVFKPGPDRAVVFQNHSLLPWLTVYQNVRLAVDKVFRSTKSVAERHEWTLHNFGSCTWNTRVKSRPSNFRRHEAARRYRACVAMSPKVLLLDEPFGALDALRARICRIKSCRSMRAWNTVMMITHDVEEAVLLSDRIVMLTNGPAASIGSIFEVPLARPRNRLELIADPTYVGCRTAVLEFLHKRHRFVDAA